MNMRPSYGRARARCRRTTTTFRSAAPCFPRSMEKIDIFSVSYFRKAVSDLLPSILPCPPRALCDSSHPQQSCLLFAFHVILRPISAWPPVCLLCLTQLLIRPALVVPSIYPISPSATTCCADILARTQAKQSY